MGLSEDRAVPSLMFSTVCAKLFTQLGHVPKGTHMQPTEARDSVIENTLADNGRLQTRQMGVRLNRETN